MVAADHLADLNAHAANAQAIRNQIPGALLRITSVSVHTIEGRPNQPLHCYAKFACVAVFFTPAWQDTVGVGL